MAEELSTQSTQVRAAAVLTNSYVASSSADLANFNQAEVMMDLTFGSLTSVEAIVEVSQDNTNWYVRLISDPPSSGTEATYPRVIQLTAANFTGYTKMTIPFPVAARYARCRFKGTGDVTGSSLAATIVANDI